MASIEVKRLLKIRRLRNRERPQFKAFESWRFVKIKPRWRRPRGIDNKMRTNEGGWPRSANIGWGGPSSVKNLHSSGKIEVLIHTINELKKIDSHKQIARIGSTVGLRKRKIIVEEADKLGIKVLNSGIKTKQSNLKVEAKK